MENNSPLKYVVDTSQARRVLLYSWSRSPYSKTTLCPIVNQKNTCICYGLTSGEAARAVINLKKKTMIDKLSTLEIVRNNFGELCQGYHTPICLEWIKETGVVEDSYMSLDAVDLNNHISETSHPPELSKNGERHKISEWEAIPNNDAEIKCNVMRQPVVASLQVADSLCKEYQGGLVDPFKMRDPASGSNHSILITGFGYYLYEDKTTKDFWLAKNSYGETNAADNGYVDLMANSSQPSIKNWVSFDPLVPLCILQDEQYKREHLVVEMPLDTLPLIAKNIDYDIIILFYKGSRDDRKFFKAFERASRLYFPDKVDVKCILVNVEGKSELELSKYQSKVSFVYPLLRIYKYVEKKPGKRRAPRNLKSGKTICFEKGDVEFVELADALLNATGGM